MNAMDNSEMVRDGLERVVDAARFLCVSRSLVYKLMNAGVLPSVKIGNTRRIPTRAVRELASSQLAETANRGGGGRQKKSRR